MSNRIPAGTAGASRGGGQDRAAYAAPAAEQDLAVQDQDMPSQFPTGQAPLDAPSHNNANMASSSAGLAAGVMAGNPDKKRTRPLVRDPLELRRNPSQDGQGYGLAALSRAQAQAQAQAQGRSRTPSPPPKFAKLDKDERHKRELRQLERKNLELLKDLNATLEKCSRAENLIVQYQKDKNAISSQLSAKERELRDSLQREAAARYQLEKSDRREHNLIDRAHQSEHYKRRLEEIERMTSKLKSAKDRKATQDQEALLYRIKLLEGEFQTTCTRNEELETAIQAFKVEIRDLQSSLSANTAALKKAKEEHDTSQRLWYDERSELEKRNTHLSEKLAHEKVTFTETIKTLKASESSARQTANDAKATLETQQSAYVQRITQLEQDLEIVESDLLRKDKELKAAQVQQRKYDDERASEASRRQEIEKEQTKLLDRLREERDQARAFCKTANDRLEQALAEAMTNREEDREERKNAIMHKDNQIASLDAKIREIKALHDAEMRSQENCIRAKDAEITEALRLLEATKAQGEQISFDLADERAKTATLEAQIAKRDKHASSRITQLESELEQSRAENKNLVSAAALHEKTFNEALADAHAKTEHFKQLSSRLEQKLADDARQWVSERQFLEQRLSDTHSQLTLARHHADAARTESSNAIAELKQDAASLRTRVAELEDDLSNERALRDAEAQRADSMCADLNKQLADRNRQLDRTLREHQHTVDKQSADLHQAKTELAEADAKHRELIQTIKRLETMQERDKAEYEEREQANTEVIREKDTSIMHLRGNLETLKYEKERLAKRVQEMQATLESSTTQLAADISAARAQRDEAIDERDGAYDEIDKLAANIDDLKEQCDMGGQALADQNARELALKHALDMQTTLYSIAQGQLDGMRTALHQQYADAQITAECLGTLADFEAHEHRLAGVYAHAAQVEVELVNRALEMSERRHEQVVDRMQQAISRSSSVAARLEMHMDDLDASAQAALDQDLATRSRLLGSIAHRQMLIASDGINESTVAVLAGACDDLDEALQQHIDSIHALEDEVTSKSSDIHRLQAELSMAEQSGRQVSAQAAELGDKLHQSESLVQQLQIQAKQDEETIAERERRLQELMQTSAQHMRVKDAQISGLNAQVDDLDKKSAAHRASLDEARSRIDLMIEELNGSHAQAAGLQADLDAAYEKIETLLGEIAETATEMANAKQQLEDKTRNLNAAIQQRDNAMDQIDVLEKRLAADTAKHREILAKQQHDAATRFTQTKSKFEADIAALQASKASLGKELADCQSRLKETISGLAQTKRAMDESRDAHKKDKKQLEDQLANALATAESRAVQLKSAQEDAAGQIEDLKTKLSESGDQLASSQQEQTVMRATISDLESKVADSLRRIDELAQQVVEATQRAESTALDLATAKSQKEALSTRMQEEAREFRAKMEQLQGELGKLRDINQAQTRDLEAAALELRSERETAKALIEKMAGEHKAAMDQALQEHSTSKSILEQQLADACDKANELEDSLGKEVAETYRLSNELADAKAALQEAKHELAETVKSSTVQLNRVISEKETLSIQMDDMARDHERAISSLQSDFSEAQSALENKLKESRDNCEQLKCDLSINREKVADLCEDLNVVQSKLNDTTADLDQTRSSLEAKVRDLEEQVRGSRDAIASLEQSLAEATQLAESRLVAINHALAEKEMLSMKVDEMANEHKDELDRLQQQVEMRAEQLDDAEKRIDGLSVQLRTIQKAAEEAAAKADAEHADLVSKNKSQTEMIEFVTAERTRLEQELECCKETIQKELSKQTALNQSLSERMAVATMYHNEVVETLSSQLAEKRMNAKELEQRVKELEAKLDVIECDHLNDTAKVKIALKEATSEINDKTRAMYDLESQLRDARQEVQKMSAEIQQLREQAKARLDEEQHMADMQNSWEDERKSFIDRLASAVADKEAVEYRCIQLKVSAEDAEKSMREMQAHFDNQMENLKLRGQLQESEAKKLSEVNAELFGHANSKQKIRHLQQVKKENLELKQENAVLEGQKKKLVETLAEKERELAAQRGMSIGQRVRRFGTSARQSLAPNMTHGNVAHGSQMGTPAAVSHGGGAAMFLGDKGRMGTVGRGGLGAGATPLVSGFGRPIAHGPSGPGDVGSGLFKVHQRPREGGLLAQPDAVDAAKEAGGEGDDERDKENGNRGTGGTGFFVSF